MSLLDDDDGLTELERSFVDAYMADERCNATEAMLKASPKLSRHSACVAASRMLQKPEVRAALKARVEGDPLIASRVERLRYLTRVLRGQEKDPRIVDGEVVELRVSAKDRMAAADMLAKAAGEYITPLFKDGDDESLTGMGIKEMFELYQKLGGGNG